MHGIEQKPIFYPNSPMLRECSGSRWWGIPGFRQPSMWEASGQKGAAPRSGGDWEHAHDMSKIQPSTQDGRNNHYSSGDVREPNGH